MPKAYVQVFLVREQRFLPHCEGLCGWGKISCGFSVDPLVVCGG